MTKAAKLRMIEHLQEKLKWLDDLVDLNEDNPSALESLLAEYRELTKILVKLRDEPTSD